MFDLSDFRQLNKGDVFYRISNSFEIEKVTFISMDNNKEPWYMFNAWFYIGDDKSKVEFINYKNFHLKYFETEFEVMRKLIFNILTMLLCVNTKFYNLKLEYFECLDNKDREKIKELEDKKRELLIQVNECEKKIENYFSKLNVQEINDENFNKGK